MSDETIERFKREYLVAIDAEAEKLFESLAASAAEVGRPLTALEHVMIVSSYKAGAADGARFNLEWMYANGLVRRRVPQ